MLTNPALPEVSSRPVHRRTLTGWGRSHRSRSAVIAATGPGWERQVTAAAAGRGVIARGAGSGYGDAATCDGGLVVDMGVRDRLFTFDPTTGRVVAQAGLTLGRLLATVAPYGWRPAVLPGTSEVTLGGAVAADVHGKNHAHAGSFGAGVEALTLVGADGERERLSPDSTPEAFWATVGGLGLTGIITEVDLQLVRMGPGWATTRRRRLSRLADAMAVLDRATGPGRASADVHAVGWVDLVHGSRSIVDVTTLPVPAGDGPPGPPPVSTPGRARRPARRLPSLPGAGVVTPRLTAVGGTLRWSSPGRKHWRQPVERALMPMAHTDIWPILFGRNGLVQYQCVIPVGRADTVHTLVDLVRTSESAPALAIIKRLGPSGRAPLGFALDGWSLALDFPATSSTNRVLDRCDEVVAEAGGRVYLTKDARLSADTVRRMYPRLDEWQAVRDRMDPQGLFVSDLGRRVGLVRARS